MNLKARSCDRCMRGVAHCGMCGDELEHFIPMSSQTEEEKRMDVVAQNGNDGLHYGDGMHDNICDVRNMSEMEKLILLKKGPPVFMNHLPTENAPLIEPACETRFNASGSKYLREAACMIDGKLDVYAVLDAFTVTCPARQHAIKKLLCAGIRGKAGTLQDLSEARDAVDRAIQMQISKGS